MWLRNIFTTKAVAIIAIYFLLFLQRKTILSVDLRVLHWLLNDMRFPDYKGHIEGFFNFGEISYNLTQTRLSGVAIEHSNIDISNLWEFKHNDSCRVSVSFRNGNVNLDANWEYSAWPALGDHGRLSLRVNNASLSLEVTIFTDDKGFINYTSECVMKIMKVNLEFYHKPNIMYDSIKPMIRKKVEGSLPEGLCKGLQRGLVKRIGSTMRNIQDKYIKFMPFSGAKSFQNFTGWILVYLFLIVIKVIHDFGVTLILILGVLAIYLLYEIFKSIASKFGATIRRRYRKTKVRSRSDPEPYPEQEKPVLNPVSVTMVSRGDETNAQQKTAFLARFNKGLLWWRKPKEN